MRRFNQPGDIHFVTFKTFQNRPIFKDEKCCELFLKNCEFYRQKYDLKIYGYVILYDHVHQLIRFDMAKFPKLTISKVMHGIKGRSAQLISKYIFSQLGSRSFYASAGHNLRQGIKALPTRKKEGKYISTRDCLKIWQPGFYDFNIYTAKKFWEKLDYIHKNPIKHKLTQNIARYKYCSLRNYELNDHSIFKIDYLEF